MQNSNLNSLSIIKTTILLLLYLSTYTLVSVNQLILAIKNKQHLVSFNFADSLYIVSTSYQILLVIGVHKMHALSCW